MKPGMRHIEKIAKKLKGSAGESLAEVLIALLIAALALTMLASVISSTARIINKTNKSMNDYYTGLERLVERTAEKESGGSASTIAFTIKMVSVNGEANTAAAYLKQGLTSPTVNYSRMGDKSFRGVEVLAYWLAEGGSTP